MLESLEILEMEMEATLKSFYDRLRSLSSSKRAAIDGELSEIERGLSGAAASSGTDAPMLAELRRTVAQLRMQVRRDRVLHTISASSTEDGGHFPAARASQPGGGRGGRRGGRDR